MAGYHFSPIAELAHQLRLSPARLRLRQLEATEYLADLIEPDKSYPYEFVCHQITGYRSRSATPGKLMAGTQLVEDLAELVEELSGQSPTPIAQVGSPSYTAEVLAGRLKVSTKTICRWRRRGLLGRKLRFPDNTVRMAFTEPCVRRFIARNAELVKRGAAFKQLSAAEKQQIVALARAALAERRMKLHELSQLIAAKMGRAVETVRYTLRRYDAAHPEAPLFGRDDLPSVEPELHQIYVAAASGESLEELSARHGKPVAVIRDIVREVRARTLKARAIRYINNKEFDAADAEEVILQQALPSAVADAGTIRPPRDLPPYLQELYRQPLLTAEQERSLFRRYNYLKHRADRMRRELDVAAATDEQMDAIDRTLDQAETVKNEILRANLRLVVSIARRHVGKSACFFEIVSDGNMSLMRAVEKFDYARGFKFSTYASWAIMRNYARTVPEHLYQAAKLVTGNDEMLTAAPARAEAPAGGVLEAAQHLVAKALDLLTPRERDIIVWHYGLGEQREPMTLDAIGKNFGVTKERVRQIERKALARLKGLLDAQQATLALNRDAN